jgi:moderate conductance mechanosensitive channel
MHKLCGSLTALYTSGMPDSATNSLTNSVADAVNIVVVWLGDHAFNIILILVTAWMLHKFGAKVVSRILAQTVRTDLYPTKSDRDKRVKTLNSLASAIIRIGVYIFAGILIIGELNPGYTTALFASAGLVTVAIGFGAKDLINDFIKGIFIIYENQYRVGDTVEIAGVSGVVEGITIRTTILRDFDGNVHHVPNGAIIVTTNKTIGFSKLNEDLVFPADTDIEQLQKIIDQVGKSLADQPDMKAKITKPPHFAGYTGFGQGGIVCKVTATVTAGHKISVTSEFYRQLLPALRKHHITPLPTVAPPATANPKAK